MKYLILCSKVDKHLNEKIISHIRILAIKTETFNVNKHTNCLKTILISSLCSFEYNEI
jgi:hypothetical protein